MSSSSSLALDKPLSCPRPLPTDLELKPNGTFLYRSCRRDRRTGLLLEGTGTPSVSAATEEEDAASFQQVVLKSLLPPVEHESTSMNGQLLLSHLSGISSSRRWDLRLAGIELRVGAPVKVCLVNGTCHEIDDIVMSSSDVVQLISKLEWDRVLPTYSVVVSGLHRVTWHPYHRLCLRMGRQQAHPECRRVTETVCTQWLSGKTRTRNARSLGVVGPTGTTTVLRQLLRTLVEYHSHLCVGVVSESGELCSMHDDVIDIPLQRYWVDVVHRKNINVLLVDVSSSDEKLMGGAREQLSLSGIFVASSHWTGADFMFHIQHEVPWYRLERKRNRLNGKYRRKRNR